MDILTGHLVVVLVFFLTALIATIAPILLARRNESKLSSHDRCHSIIDVSNSIGGGVLLATCFIALVPLVENSYKNALLAMNSPHIDRPFAEITILSGFFLVVFIEQLVTLVQQRRANVKNAAHIQMASHEEQETLFSDEEPSSGAQSSHHGSTSHSHSHSFDAKSLLHSVILVVTLGLHTLFEGMAIGLVDNIDTLVALAVAVLFHELCCAVALGVNLSKQKISTKAAMVVCLIFSLMMPVGIALGMAVGQVNGVAGLLLTAILQGVATGTFLFVLFIEIVPSVISSSNPGFKMALMMLGCIFMTLLIVFTESHDHGQNLSASASCPDMSTVSQVSGHTPKSNDTVI
ncbi:zinc transporter ZIP3-like [Watersipora subatra]|uniref:zinc transporter ZIP3-like n=1 Tax=Watersipora subatra TaxID=2589382 RepID=UPI00355C88B3